MGRKAPTFSRRAPNVAHLKPEKFQDYLTLAELAREVYKDPSWIRKLERAGRIPKAKRHNTGTMEVRLYSPAAVEEIRQIFNSMRVGRPKIKQGGVK